MMKLLFASRNLNKLKEVSAILENQTVISLREFNDEDEVIEEGNTFHENAYKKAKHFYDKYKVPTFADDSGLVVPVLNDEPGIMSARYAGEDATDAENNQKLLKKLIGSNNRDAYFITVICYIDKEGHTSYFEGRVDGIILTELKGTDGFGYDPLFYLPEYGKTYAELGNEKNKISHRYLALEKLNKFLNKDD